MKIIRRKSNMTQICGVWLQPGVNEVPDDKVAIIKESKQFKHEVRCGVIEIVGETPPPEAVVAPTVKIKVETQDAPGLSGMNAKNSVMLIGETLDKSLLADWRKIEEKGKSRKTVLAAIDDQTEMLTDKSEDEGDEAETEPTEDEVSAEESDSNE